MNSALGNWVFGLFGRRNNEPLKMIVLDDLLALFSYGANREAGLLTIRDKSIGCYGSGALVLPGKKVTALLLRARRVFLREERLGVPVRSALVLMRCLRAFKRGRIKRFPVKELRCCPPPTPHLKITSWSCVPTALKKKWERISQSWQAG